MRKAFVLSVVFVLACSICHAHDNAKAKQYLNLYSQCDGKQIGKSLFMMKPDIFVSKIKSGEEVFVLDVRTKAEEQIVGMNIPNTLFVPMNKVFEESTLSKLPTDKPIVVLCRKGVRSSLVTMGLRDIGFNNAFCLHDGLRGLIEFLTPKAAN
ncbi:rhodanese-like domain-containing protein [Thermodesulfobacteriota bacterium]